MAKAKREKSEKQKPPKKEKPAAGEQQPLIPDAFPDRIPEIEAADKEREAIKVKLKTLRDRNHELDDTIARLFKQHKIVNYKYNGRVVTASEKQVIKSKSLRMPAGTGKKKARVTVTITAGEAAPSGPWESATMRDVIGDCKALDVLADKGIETLGQFEALRASSFNGAWHGELKGIGRVAADKIEEQVLDYLQAAQAQEPATEKTT